MFVSNGEVVDTKSWTTQSWPGVANSGDPGALWPIGSPGSWTCSHYAALYRRQPWVRAVVRKIATATARLPLKAYGRTVDGRQELASSDRFAALIAAPSTKLDPWQWKRWLVSTWLVFGFAPFLKLRDTGGAPVELVPIHPSRLHFDARSLLYSVSLRSGDVVDIPGEEIVVIGEWNADDPLAPGSSPLDSLADSLELDRLAVAERQAANRNSARPSVVLRTPKALSDEAGRRLKAQWNEIHSGPENRGRTALLEEGMEAQIISQTAEEMQWADTRRFSREEVCAAFDVAPTVVGILDHATFSNITEQLRAFYRDTIAGIVSPIEAAIEFQVRRRDFPGPVYAEFLMDDVLRGSFEVRVAAYQQGISGGWLTPNEVRQLENRPAMPGGDRLLVQGAMVPLEVAGANKRLLSLHPHQRSVMGALGRLEQLDGVDPADAEALRAVVRKALEVIDV